MRLPPGFVAETSPRVASSSLVRLRICTRGLREKGPTAKHATYADHRKIHIIHLRRLFPRCIAKRLLPSLTFANLHDETLAGFGYL
jgi:hypothetical protein